MYLDKRDVLAIVAKTLLVILITVGVAACNKGLAYGNKYDYQKKPIKFEMNTENSVGVAVVDLRSYVLSNEKKLDFVGIQHADFLSAFDVTTQSGKPLADEIALSIVAGLKKQDINAEVPPSSAITSIDEARAVLVTKGYSRYLILYLNEWKSDTAPGVQLFHDIQAEILDDTGKKLASNEIQGARYVGPGISYSRKSILTGFGNANHDADFVEDAVLINYRLMLKKFLNTPEIKAAIEG